MRLLVLLPLIALLLAACAGEEQLAPAQPAGAAAPPPAGANQAAANQTDGEPPAPAPAPDAPARPDLEAQPAATEPASLPASAAGFTTAQQAILQIQRAAGGPTGCSEAFETAIAAEGSEPHGLTPNDPIPAQALAVIRGEFQGAPDDYELRVFTETAIIFVSRDGLSTNPAIFAAAIEVQHFVNGTRTFWAAPEGAFWTRC